MNTFIFALVISIATPTEEGRSWVVIDHSLSGEDCNVLVEAYEPTVAELPNGVTVWTSPLCELEREHD